MMTINTKIIEMTEASAGVGLLIATAQKRVAQGFENTQLNMYLSSGKHPHVTCRDANTTLKNPRLRDHQ